MGKYSLHSIIDLDEHQVQQLNNIANELAEANRLKRLELRFRNKTWCPAAEFNTYLADRA